MVGMIFFMESKKLTKAFPESPHSLPKGVGYDFS